MNRSILLALGMTLATGAVHAQSSAITYPSVARTPAVAVAEAPAVRVQGERVRVERARIATEPLHSVFVYEVLGATPRLRLMRAPAPAVAATPPVAVAATR